MEKINIDFQIVENSNPKNITIFDTSSWGHIVDKPSIIEITVPGFDKPVVHYFDKRSVNYFNSLNLSLNCEGCNDEEADLPDGIYEITVKGSPDKFYNTKSYLKTDTIRLQLDEMFTKIDFCKKDVDSTLVKSIQKIDLYIKAAEAHVRFDNICSAQELLFKAQEDMNKLKNCKTCI